MSDWLHGVKVPALRIADIRSFATSIRQNSQIGIHDPFPVLDFLEFSLTGGIDGFDWISSDDLPRGVEACAYPDGCAENPDGPYIKIRDTVYEAAHRREGRARLTILHECGHILLHRKVAVHHRGAIGAQLAPYEFGMAGEYLRG